MRWEVVCWEFVVGKELVIIIGRDLMVNIGVGKFYSKKNKKEGFRYGLIRS